MTRSLILQDFAAPAPAFDGEVPIASTVAAPVAAEEEVDTLETFDAGYKSGWADCAAAEAEERRSIGADLTKAVSEATLTQEAARRDVLAALGPFFEEVVGTLLPAIAAKAVAPTVLAELSALADGQTLARVEIHAAPSVCQTLERVIELENVADLDVRPEPAFAEGQVSIRAGTERRDLDMAAATARIAEAIVGFSTQVTLSENVELSQGVA